MDPIQRFGEYAAAFEKAFDSDDWSVIEPYFTEDAVYEVVDSGPFSGRAEGQEALKAHFKQILDQFDRRFDSREPQVLEGPALRDGAVWMRWRVIYRVAGAPEYAMDGEERAWFQGDRIRRLEDRIPEESGRLATAFLRDHAKALKPAGS